MHFSIQKPFNLSVIMVLLLFVGIFCEVVGISQEEVGATERTKERHAVTD